MTKWLDFRFIAVTSAGGAIGGKTDQQDRGLTLILQNRMLGVLSRFGRCASPVAPLSAYLGRIDTWSAVSTMPIIDLFLCPGYL